MNTVKFHDEMRKASGGVVIEEDKLTSLFYQLMRDHLPAGALVAVVQQIVAEPSEIVYTNGWLANSARYLADLLRKKVVEKLPRKEVEKMRKVIERDIARVAHEVNRAYCESIGDNSQVSWEEAPRWERDSAINGVVLHLNNDTTPEDSHAAWVKQKKQDGWVYGDEKDADKKTHPRMVPYDQLPQEQRVKDYLFKAVVESMRT